MRIHNHKWNTVGRRILILLLLCGLLLPLLPQVEADTVTYHYEWIKDESQLPNQDDGQWHDYFIAWEDTDEKNKYWFTDYHWYTASGNNNIDAGGTHWMEYKAASTLPDSTSDSFSSNEKRGHMQIRYAGVDGRYEYAAKYYIRVSKMNGGYMYFTQYEPSNNESDAEPFTFLDKGDVFHIVRSVGGKADRYLTRNGQYLETTESTSAGGGEYYRELRVYKQTYTVNEEEDEISDDVIGKTTLYEYSWVNTADEMLALTKSNQWTDIMIAWEDADGGGTSNPNKVWYTKEVWYDESNKPNYSNAKTEYYYYSNDILGSDGYSSAYAENFLLPYEASHFEVKFVDWDKDNPIYGYTNAEGKTQSSPMFQIRFDAGHGKYFYLGNDHFEENAGSALNYTVQLRLGKGNDEDILGSVHIFRNIAVWDDEYLTRKKNRFDVSNDNGSKYWEYPFRIYSYRPVEYDAIVKSFTIGKGATYSIDKQLIVEKGVTITVENGGVLMVDDHLLNNGKIIVKDGGTVIVNEGAYIMAYSEKANGTITMDGGNLVIMDGGKVICDQGNGSMEAKNGATILNRGLLLVGNSLSLSNNSYLKNEAGATLLVGCRVAKERGGIGAFSFDEIKDRVFSEGFTFLCSNKSKIINKGLISLPEEVLLKYSKDAKTSITHVDGGSEENRIPY